MPGKIFYALLAPCIAMNSHALEALFYPDNNVVTMLAQDELDNKLWQLKLPSAKLATLNPQIPQDEVITSLAKGADGELLMLTQKSIYAYDGKSTRKLCSSEWLSKDVELIGSTASADKKQPLHYLLRSEEQQDGKVTGAFYTLKPAAADPVDVFARRTYNVGQGAFAAKGRFFYVADNALWEGKFNDMDQERVVLEGAAIAPLAYCDSNMSNTGSYFMDDSLAVCADHVYAMLRGRHGVCVLLQVKIPAKSPACDGTEDEEALCRHYNLQAASLQSARGLFSEQNISCFAVSSGKQGLRVFYIRQSRGFTHGEMMLWSSATQKSVKLGEFDVKE